jgi:hypothetical protein
MAVKSLTPNKDQPMKRIDHHSGLTFHRVFIDGFNKTQSAINAQSDSEIETYCEERNPGEQAPNGWQSVTGYTDHSDESDSEDFAIRIRAKF